MKHILHVLFWIFFSCNKVKSWPCASPIRQAYSRINSDAALQFSADLTNLVSPRRFDIKFYDGSIKARIIYNPDKTSTTEALQGVSVTGDAAGNVVVTLMNVQQNNAGVYTMAVAGFSTKCYFLYILGTPRKPTVTVNKTPSVGESVTFTCSSTSTTTPSNHSLSLTYSWRFDNTDNPGGSKYSYTPSKDKLTVNNIVKEDANKQFTCTATEDVTGGYTTSRSDTSSFDVYYGPDNVAFSPSDTSYEKDENESLNQVTCTATCYPTCSFTWTKTEIGRIVSSSALLNLGRLQSSDAGTYRCTATRIGGAPQSKDLTVNVIYGPRNMFFNPTAVSYRHNENYNLAPITCGADCWKYSYSWSGPNSFSVPGAVLNLGPLTKAMAGTYTCTARNVKLSQQSLQTKQLLLEVRFGPDSIKVTNGKSVYTLDEGTRLNDIKCEADCFPACTYKWTKDGQNTGNTDTLSLGQVNKSSAGHYTCRATNGDIQTRWKEKKVTIYVRYGPYQSSTKISPSTQNYTKNEGQSLNDITCSADCYPDCTYTWRKTRHGQTTTVSSTSVLSIGQLHRENAALYTCIAKNPDKISSSTTTIQTLVIVRYGPDSAILSRTSPRIVTEGDKDEKIECTSDCYPGCSYKWTKNTSSSAITSSRVLQLNTVLRENAGDYKCISTNTATSQFSKSAESTIKIIVQYAPDVNISLSTTSVKERESLTLLCNGHGVPSSYIYTSLIQSSNNVVIPNNNTAVENTKKNSSLYFKSLRLDDTGTYTCTLNNGISNLSGIPDQSGRREIIVQVSPKILRDDLRFTGSTGDAINIEIPIYSNPVFDTIEITRYDGQAISSDMYTVMDDSVETHFYGKDVTLPGNVLYLTLNDAREEDFGNYSFKITNVIDTTQTFVNVIAEGPPLPPKFLQLLSEKNVLKFVWQKDFNGGLQQYFIIQTSIVGTETWTNLLNVSEVDSKYKLNSTFYTANITGLSPETYTARIVSINAIGSLGYTELATTFVIEREFQAPNRFHRTGTFVAVIITVVLIAAAICIGLFIWKKRKSVKEQANGNIYESTSRSDTTSQEPYEVLHGFRDSNTSDTYDSLNTKEKDARINPFPNGKDDIARQTHDTTDKNHWWRNIH